MDEGQVPVILVTLDPSLSLYKEERSSSATQLEIENSPKRGNSTTILYSSHSLFHSIATSVEGRA